MRSVPTAWTLTVSRTDLADAVVTEHPVPTAGPGEVVLAVDRVGLTANNVTYAVLGESFRYWEHFPSADPARGVPPLWGFVRVVESRAEGVTVGDRLWGYVPAATHLVVTPTRVDGRGFRDGAAHRTALPQPYRVYALTTADEAYEAEREDLLVLFRPLFYTSFMLADFLVDHGLFGAQRVALSSASSRTAYGAAFELHRRGVPVVGLTSPRHRGFVEALGCYDVVATYDEVGALDAGTDTVFADVAGREELTVALRAHLGERLRHEVVVGITHQVAHVAGTIDATGVAMFFAPDQMRKRVADWGRPRLDSEFAQAWRRFAAAATDWVDVAQGQGPDALRQAWLDVLGGGDDPRTGHVLTP